MTTAKKSVKKAIKARKASSEKKSGGPKTAEGKPARAAVTVDRRASADRRGEDRRKKGLPVAVERRVVERRAKVARRRQIDPTTCERDYSQDELEFMSALDQYKRANGRMFPTCSEVLEVIRSLGYEKRPQIAADHDTAGELAAQQASEMTAV